MGKLDNYNHKLQRALAHDLPAVREADPEGVWAKLSGAANAFTEACRSRLTDYAESRRLTVKKSLEGAGERFGNLIAVDGVQTFLKAAMQAHDDATIVTAAKELRFDVEAGVVAADSLHQAVSHKNKHNDKTQNNTSPSICRRVLRRM